jgi:hypothetical protein
MKKIGLLCLALVLALGSLGVGYAMWYQTVYIHGDVTTGNLQMCIEENTWLVKDGEVGADWNAITACDAGIPEVFPAPGGKDVGWTELNWNDCNSLDVVVHNAYPCYYNHIDIYVDNIGTIPTKQWKAVVTYDSNTWTFYNSSYQCLDLDGVDGPDLWLRFGDSWGVQQEPGGFYDLSFDFHVLQPAPQGATLEFTIAVTWVQWNEYQAGPIPPP